MSQSQSLKPLYLSQFFGAFNDNAWKIMVTLLAIASLSAGDSFEADSQSLTTTAFLVFTIPLLIFSLPAALIADRISKSRLIVILKGFEILLMAAALFILCLAPGDTLAPLLVLALLGAQSAFFSPAKYGIIPELLPETEISSANAALEMGTFAAIILGSAVGGVLLDLSGTQPAFAAAFLLLAAIVGFVAARRIPKTPAASLATADRGFVIIRKAHHSIVGDKALLKAVIASCGFWFVASLMGQTILIYAKSTLALSDRLAPLPMATFGIGIGLGCFIAGLVSRRGIEIGLSILGAFGLGASCAVFGMLEPGFLGTSLSMLLMGVAAGLIIVPIDSLIQARSPKDSRGAVIAIANAATFAAMALGSLGALSLSKRGISSSGIAVITGSLSLIAALYAVQRALPQFLRACLLGLMHLRYRVKQPELSQIPQQGSALIVANHVSFLDWLFISASTSRPIRYVIDAEYYDKPWLRPLFRVFGCIPIAGSGDPKTLIQGVRATRKCLENGELVGLFAEGALTRTGRMEPFQSGIERILKGIETAVIPIHLDGLWESSMSRNPDIRWWQAFKLGRRNVGVAIGEPLSSPVPKEVVHRAIQDLAYLNFNQREESKTTLAKTFVALARRHPMAGFLDDKLQGSTRRGMALIKAVTLARTLSVALGEDAERRVGVMLPPSQAAALLNIAITMSGRSVVNLNFSAGAAAMEKAVKLGEVKTVISSSAFLTKAKIAVPKNCRMIELSELVASIPFPRKFVSALAACSWPMTWISSFCGAKGVKSQTEATLIFSSGSTGDPKGIPLSHFNLLANTEQVLECVPLCPRDRLMGILPLFHAFGTMSLWLAATSRLAITFYPNPLDGAGVGQSIEKSKATILLATPTMLQLYMRRCQPGQLASLRMVIAGAEKLRDETARAFEDRFGVPVWQGYGATECSPVVALNTPSQRVVGIFQKGNRVGSVGKLLNGMTFRLVDPDHPERQVQGKEVGELLLKGPNLFTGYLNAPKANAQAFFEGWYRTGDLARIDEEGFLRIEGRQSRFAKIGGEMVPCEQVEEALHAAIGAEERRFVVCALPDAQKGEILGVLHNYSEAALDGLLEKLRSAGLPALYLPRLQNFRWIECLPFLGSGKVDLRQALGQLIELGKSPAPGNG